MHSALEIGTRLGSQTARAVNHFGSIRHIRMQARVVFEIANCAVSCDSVAKTFLLSRGQPLARRGPPLLCRAPARVQRTGQLEQLVMRCIPPAYGLCLLYLRLQSGGQALVSLEAGYSSHGQQGQAGRPHPTHNAPVFCTPMIRVQRYTPKLPAPPSTRLGRPWHLRVFRHARQTPMQAPQLSMFCSSAGFCPNLDLTTPSRQRHRGGVVGRGTGGRPYRKRMLQFS